MAPRNSPRRESASGSRLWLPAVPNNKLVFWLLMALAITDELSTIVLSTVERTSPLKAMCRTAGHSSTMISSARFDRITDCTCSSTAQAVPVVSR